jgi:hypothetical protein
MTSATDTAQPDPTGPPTTPPVEVPPAWATQPDWQGPPYGYVPPAPDRITRLINRIWTGSPLWVAPAAMLACMGSAVGYTLIADPANVAADAAPSCLLKYTTGFVCPGCGGTRAAWYLLHGDLPAAARHHAIFVFAVPFLLYMYVSWAGNRVFGWRLRPLRLSPGAIGAFLAVWGVWSVLRNLPWAPFTWFFV